MNALTRSWFQEIRLWPGDARIIILATLGLIYLHVIYLPYAYARIEFQRHSARGKE